MINPRKTAVYGLLAMESILYIAFIILGFIARRPFTTLTIMLQYASMVLVPVIALVCNDKHTGDFRLLIAALLLSLANETLMLFGSSVIFFISVYALVQVLYIFRHGKGRLPRPVLFFIAVPFWAVLAVVALRWDLYPDKAVAAAVCLYGLLFTVGLVVVWKYENTALARWGMTFFACCDVCLMLYYGLDFALVPGILVWFFFLPAQVMLALSGRSSEKPMNKGFS